MPTDVPTDKIDVGETPIKCDSMTLVSTPTARRGSTPLPIKHQLRREEAVHDDCDWVSGAGAGLAPPPPINFSMTLDDASSLAGGADDRPDGPLRMALLGQSGVGEGYMRTVTVDEEDSAIIIYDNWRQDLSALRCEVCVLVFSVTDRRSFHRTAQLRLLLRETQPQTPIILVGNKSDLVRSREVSAQEAVSSAALFQCLYLEISASLDHRTPELLECAVRLARGQAPWLGSDDMLGQRESITSRAKRFLTNLVPRYPRDREREAGRFFRQKSRSCHDLGAL
ncbi:hypothetical protein NHX12_032915 [Muraenolepis orangiensis]|uniref:Small monomeric GTPase n=1 Tax=Muraenolepis orangiensis TaxID=630683 RepID=A0A9Q0E6M3_9TELE|nr:hypothetical protein NHX12_032915 [Muraenolepis orangiensis]